MPATQLPAATVMGPVTLVVSDLGRVRPFYEGVLGMAPVVDDADRVTLGARKLDGDGYRPIVVLIERPDAPRRPRGAPGLYHVALLMPSRAALAQVLRRLTQVRYHLQGAADHAVSEALYLADPEGNGIEIYADTPKETWRREGDTIYMGTAPLDVRGLLGEANGEREWRGFPAGSRVGHVHLRVRDLEETARFYQGVVGLDVTARYGDQASFFSAGGYHHHLGANTWESRGAAPAPEGALGLAHYTVVVPTPQDVRDVEARAARANQQATVDKEGLWMRDPSGNVLCIMDAAAAGIQERRAPGSLQAGR